MGRTAILSARALFSATALQLLQEMMHLFHFLCGLIYVVVARGAHERVEGVRLGIDPTHADLRDHLRAVGCAEVAFCRREIPQEVPVGFIEPLQADLMRDFGHGEASEPDFRRYGVHFENRRSNFTPDLNIPLCGEAHFRYVAPIPGWGDNLNFAGVGHGRVDDLSLEPSLTQWSRKTNSENILETF